MMHTRQLKTVSAVWVVVVMLVLVLVLVVMAVVVVVGRQGGCLRRTLMAFIRKARGKRRR